MGAPQGQPIDFATGGAGGCPPALLQSPLALVQGPAETLEIRGVGFDASSSVAIFEGGGFPPVGLPTISSVLFVPGVAPALPSLLVELDTSLASGAFAAVVTGPSCRAIVAFSVIAA